MAESTPISATDMPAGEYAIVEALGHRTLVGRVAEIERFGTKMLQVEPLFGDVMLAPVLLGGSSIYQFTPCSADVAFARRPTRNYELPASIFATVPAAALTSNAEGAGFFDVDDEPDFSAETCLIAEKAQSVLNQALEGRLPMAAGLGTAIIGEPRLGTEIAEEFGVPRANDSDRDQHANWGWPMLEIEPWPEPIPMRGRQGFWPWPTPQQFAGDL